MSIITISTPFNIDLEFRIAPFHKRLLAWLLDLLIIVAYIIIISKVFSWASVGEFFSSLSSFFLIILPAYLYYLLLEVFFRGQTVGKMALGIKVMDISGNEASFSQYLVRWVLRSVDFIFTLGIAGVISAAVSKYTQRLGDLAAGTIVIDNKYEANINETIYLEIGDKNYKPRFPQVIQLSDRDINGIHNLLSMKRSSHSTDEYMIRVVQRIKELLKIESDMYPREFLEQLLWDYNFLTRK